MKLRLPFALACLTVVSHAQLLPDQKLQDFQQLAALYAKQYAPYEWKRDALHVDLLQIAPWLTRVRNTKSDIEFYEVSRSMSPASMTRTRSSSCPPIFRRTCCSRWTCTMAKL